MIRREISNRRFQIDALDGLRGFAALIVVLSHTSNLNMYFFPFLDLRGIGKSGVYLFFLLSSFLLTLPLIQYGKKILTYSVMSAYWQRRFFRIYPLYTCYLLVALVSSWLTTRIFGVSFGQPFDLDLAGFMRHLFLQESKGLTWSIAVEFKFYFVLPVLVLVSTFVRSKGILAAQIFFIFLLLLSQLIFPQSQAVVNDSRLLPYLPVFIFGVAIAFIQDHIQGAGFESEYSKKLLHWLGFVGVGGVVIMTPLVYSLFCEQVASSYFHKQFILYSLFWSLVMLSAINVKGVIQNFFSCPLLRFYGAISFSLYLLHPIFIIAALYSGWNGYFNAWFVLVASTTAAFVSFRYLEYPISKLRFDAFPGKCFRFLMK